VLRQSRSATGPSRGEDSESPARAWAAPADNGTSGDLSRWIPGADLRARPEDEAGLNEKCFVWFADKHPGAGGVELRIRGKTNID